MFVIKMQTKITEYVASLTMQLFHWMLIIYSMVNRYPVNHEGELKSKSKSNSLFMTLIASWKERTRKKMKLNEQGRQNSWQFVKHAKLYSDLFQAWKSEHVVALDSM